MLIASGPISLGGATLNLSIGGGYVPTLGDQLTIIANNSGSPVTGQFANFPEGGTTSIDSSTFRITYLGGASGHLWS